MGSSVLLPEDFADYLTIENATQRFEEAMQVAERTHAAGIELFPNLDHAAIFTDPPHLVAGPLKELGYINGWDTRCYPSPVDGCDYINVPARLPDGSPALKRGWFRHVAVVHPVDQTGRDKMLDQGYGNPFLHHVTWGIVPPERNEEDDFAYAGRIVPFMVDIRRKMADIVEDQPGTLICALPQGVIEHPEFQAAVSQWIGDLPADQYQFEAMQGGGFLIQFFVLTGGRIEVALRAGTTQTFNPKSVHKISTDEISTEQGCLIDTTPFIDYERILK